MTRGSSGLSQTTSACSLWVSPGAAPAITGTTASNCSCPRNLCSACGRYRPELDATATGVAGDLEPRQQAHERSISPVLSPRTSHVTGNDIFQTLEYPLTPLFLSALLSNTTLERRVSSHFGPTPTSHAVPFSGCLLARERLFLRIPLPNIPSPTPRCEVSRPTLYVVSLLLARHIPVNRYLQNNGHL